MDLMGCSVVSRDQIMMFMQAFNGLYRSKKKAFGEELRRQMEQAELLQPMASIEQIQAVLHSSSSRRQIYGITAGYSIIMTNQIDPAHWKEAVDRLLDYMSGVMVEKKLELRELSAEHIRLRADLMSHTAPLEDAASVHPAMD